MIDRYLRHIKAGKAANTIRDRGKLLRRAARDLPHGLKSGSEEISDWLAQFDHPSNETRANYRAHLAGFYTYWADPSRRPHFDFNPMDDVPRVRAHRGRPRPVSEETLAYALANLDAWSARGIRLAAQAGFRCCEMAAAERADFDPDQIVVRGKGGAVKVVACHPQVWADIRPLPPGPIFYTKHGQQATAHYMTARLSEALAGIGLVGVTAHRFRHRFGTRINRYVDTRTAQEFLRHEHLSSTAIYTQVGNEQRAAAIRALDVAA